MNKELSKEMKQQGVIVFGPDIVARVWVDQAKAEGYVVMIRDGFAELYK